MRKETVDIDIIVTSGNGDTKIMQSIRVASRPATRKRKWTSCAKTTKTTKTNKKLWQD